MNCAECKELLVGYIEGLLEDSQKQAIESHLESCPPCRAELEALTNLRDRLTANGKTLAQRNLENKVLDRILQQQSLKLRKAEETDRQFKLWRIIMKSQITKFATAAAIIIVAAISLTYWGKLTSATYALEQTIKANHSVYYLHIKIFVPLQDEPTEAWVEFDESGQVKNVRGDLPEWAGAGDGPKAIVWKENKAQVWIKRKKSLVIIRDRTIAAQFLQLAEHGDPKLAVERLKEQEEQGEIEMTIDAPSNKAEPIVVTATSIQENDSPFQRMVLFVDQATKLVNSVELYQLKDGKYQKMITTEYYDYNQPIDAKMFSLDDEVPADVMRVDQAGQEIGLAQGDLTDKQIAVEVVRQFLEALKNRDYAKAGRLYEGVPAEVMQERYGKFNIVRIISIGEPEPHPIPKVGGFRVSCKVEIEKDGVKSIWEPYGAGVRQVYGQPGRWDIHGGVSPPGQD